MLTPEQLETCHKDIEKLSNKIAEPFKVTGIRTNENNVALDISLENFSENYFIVFREKFNRRFRLMTYRKGSGGTYLYSGDSTEMLAFLEKLKTSIYRFLPFFRLGSIFEKYPRLSFSDEKDIAMSFAVDGINSKTQEYENNREYHVNYILSGTDEEMSVRTGTGFSQISSLQDMSDVLNFGKISDKLKTDLENLTISVDTLKREFRGHVLTTKIF